MATTGQAGAAPSYTQQQNDAARAYVIANSREMFQQVYAGAVPAPIVGNTTAIQLRNVGMVKRLVVEVTGTVAATAGETQNITKWGLANIFSNINVTDLSNYQRINTTGWHLYTLASLRRQMAYGAAYLNDAPVSFGANMQVNDGPATVNAGTGAKTFRMFFECPLAYSDVDLRGAIYSAVVNATWQLQFTINPQFFAAAGADPVNSAYQSSSAQVGTLSNVNITIYQVYLDQLPFVQGQPVLPYFDIATGYLITNTTVSSLTQNQDFPIQYPNFRQILSASFIYDNGGQQNAGTDINSIGIQAANLVFLYKTDPYTLALKVRNTIGDDPPPGSYILETRMQPINTTTYGNMQIVINPSLVNANANIQLGWEMFGIINQVAGMGGSLPGG